MPGQNVKNTLMVDVVVPNMNGKAIVTNGDRTYIIKAQGYYKGQSLVIDLDLAIEMPSFLFALAAVFNNDTALAIKFIKENF